VQGGDILVRIAKKFCVTAQQIADFNSWPNINHNMFPGDVINIPPQACAPGSATASTQASTQSSTQSSTKSSTQTTTAGQTTTTFDTSKGGTYTVVAGDTLSRVATRNGTTVAAIVAANGWKDANHLIYAGLKIKLPAKTG